MLDEQNERKVTKAERPMRDLMLLMPHLPIRDHRGIPGQYHRGPWMAACRSGRPGRNRAFAHGRLPALHQRLRPEKAETHPSSQTMTPASHTATSTSGHFLTATSGLLEI